MRIRVVCSEGGAMKMSVFASIAAKLPPHLEYATFSIKLYANATRAFLV